MAKSKSKAGESTPREDPEVLANLAQVEIEEGDDPLVVQTAPKSTAPAPAIPAMTDPGWTAYVLSLLTDKEKVNERPKVAGLRRVVPLLLGEILENTIVSIQAPNPTNQHTATVMARLVIHWHTDGSQRTFSGLADVFRGLDGHYAGNTDPKFARFPSSMADTRAEGRALRKALMIDAVVSEELCELPVEEPPTNGLCDQGQQNFIEIKCEQLDIDLLKFINRGKKEEDRYDDLGEIPRQSAQAMLDRLDQYQRKTLDIPENIRGYNKNWRHQ